MNSDLLSMWASINDQYFDGRLDSIADIDWHPMSGEDGFDAFGMYVFRAKSIAIDERFKFDHARIVAGDQAETAKVEVAFRLVLHEMIHQALHQKGVVRFGGHGEDFVEEAAKVAAKLGVAPPTIEDARRWPNLAEILASYGV